MVTGEPTEIAAGGQGGLAALRETLSQACYDERLMGLVWDGSATDETVRHVTVWRHTEFGRVTLSGWYPPGDHLEAAGRDLDVKITRMRGS